jgi:L-cysteine:1D-myo-inositol 2-amino-2-deoxy-alpha-D-glucopyranoside ligase
VECAAIASEYLGVAFDVQAGGSDLVFPHHEMSASHARVAFAPAPNVFARVYAHAGMVSFHGEKMSKSLGNLVFVNRLLADGVDAMAIRLALLAHHYSSDWEWTDDVLAEAKARLTRWRSAAAREHADASGGAAAGAATAEAVLAGVRAAQRDDLDAPRALAVIDAWADAVLTEGNPSEGSPSEGSPSEGSPSEGSPSGQPGPGAELVRRTADALLGISL